MFRGGAHEARNCLILWRDIHSLFDLGYLTDTPKLGFEDAVGHSQSAQCLRRRTVQSFAPRIPPAQDLSPRDGSRRPRPPTSSPSGWTNARSPAYRADSVETLACLLAARVARNVSIGGFAK